MQLHLYHVHGRSICHSAVVGYSILSLALNSTKWDLCRRRELGEERAKKSRLKVLWSHLILPWFEFATCTAQFAWGASFLLFLLQTSLRRNSTVLMRAGEYKSCHHTETVEKKKSCAITLFRQFSKSATKKREKNKHENQILSEKIAGCGTKENIISSETE